MHVLLPCPCNAAIVLYNVVSLPSFAWPIAETLITSLRAPSFKIEYPLFLQLNSGILSWNLADLIRGWDLSSCHWPLQTAVGTCPGVTKILHEQISWGYKKGRNFTSPKTSAYVNAWCFSKYLPDHMWDAAAFKHGFCALLVLSCKGRLNQERRPDSASCLLLLLSQVGFYCFCWEGVSHCHNFVLVIKSGAMPLCLLYSILD